MANFADVRKVMMEISPEKVFKLELLGRVKGTRLRKGISQSELSRLTGVPQKTISRMENGLSVPTLETICKLIDAMGCKINFTLEEKE